MDNIELAHKNARRDKKHYPAVMRVDRNKGTYLSSLQEMLKSESFVNSEYTVFFKRGLTKDRWIYKLPYYPDRIVHHCIVQVLDPIWRKNLIRDTYSAIPGRGIHDGVCRMKGFLADKDASRYCLKMDIAKFYPSISHDILKKLLRAKIKCKPTLNLLDKIIDSGPGVPIGNYLSQYFGNLFLSPFDHFMKEEVGCKRYSRYCDDIVVLNSSKKLLHDTNMYAHEYLKNNLDLNVKDNYQIFPTFTRGLDYLGYIFYENYTLIRKRIVKQFKKKVKKIKTDCYKMPVTQIINTIMSYYGWFKHADAWNLWNRYIDNDVKFIISTICHNNQIKNPLRRITC